MNKIRKQLIIFVLSIVITDSVMAAIVKFNVPDADGSISIHGTITEQ